MTARGKAVPQFVWPERARSSPVTQLFAEVDDQEKVSDTHNRPNIDPVLSRCGMRNTRRSEDICLLFGNDRTHKLWTSSRRRM